VALLGSPVSLPGDEGEFFEKPVLTNLGSSVQSPNIIGGRNNINNESDFAITFR
jgi:hypothetical protein